MISLLTFLKSGCLWLVSLTISDRREKITNWFICYYTKDEFSVELTSVFR